MQLKFTNNSILSRHYTNYLQMLEKNNNKLISRNLTELEIQNLYNKEYNLSEFEFYKYITAYDQIEWLAGSDKYKLTEGINNKKNIYNNILIDLYYQNIPSKIINQYPISIVFGIKQLFRGDIKDLTRSEIVNNYYLED